MIFCTTDFTLPYLNFAAEYYLATRKHFDEDVFMLWRNEPSVIIGRYQNAYEEVNLEYIKETLTDVDYIIFIATDRYEVIDLSKIDVLIQRAKTGLDIRGGRQKNVSLKLYIDI